MKTIKHMKRVWLSLLQSFTVLIENYAKVITSVFSVYILCINRAKYNMPY